MLRKTLKRSFFYNLSTIHFFSRKFSSNIPNSISPIAPTLEEKIQTLEKSQPFFDRLLFFDPDVMASLPKPLQMFDPIVEATKVLLNLPQKNLFFYRMS